MLRCTVQKALNYVTVFVTSHATLSYSGVYVYVCVCTVLPAPKGPVALSPFRAVFIVSVTRN